MKTSILTTLRLCLLYLCISYSQPLSSTCNCGSSDDVCWDFCLYTTPNDPMIQFDDFPESNAIPCGLIRICPKYPQHHKCKGVPKTIPGRCPRGPPTTTPWPPTTTFPGPPTGKRWNYVKLNSWCLFSSKRNPNFSWAG